MSGFTQGSHPLPLAGPPLQHGFSLMEAAASIVVIAFCILLYTRTQGAIRKNNHSNSRIHLAGNLITKHLENIRIETARDTLANWPPASGVIEEDKGITLTRTVVPALSPQDGATLPMVRKVEIVACWVNIPPTSQDTLRITTYVARRF